MCQVRLLYREHVDVARKVILELVLHWPCHRPLYREHADVARKVIW